MTEYINRILEVEETVPLEPSTPSSSRWSRSARLSLWSFLSAIIFFIIGVITLLMATYSGWFGFYPDDPHGSVAVVCSYIVIISVLTCLISGFIAVKRCRFVLWWLIPVLLVVGYFVFLISS